MPAWRLALELDAHCRVTAGSPDALAAALARAADLSIGTTFRHNEHIDTASPSPELIRETAEFAVTYLIDGRWAAGIMSLRQPINLPLGFGPRPSMSFFLYNQDGSQAIARPYLDGGEGGERSEDRGQRSEVRSQESEVRGQRSEDRGQRSEVRGQRSEDRGQKSEESVPPDARPERQRRAGSPRPDMPKYHVLDAWDSDSNAPSENFIYDFDHYRYFVNDSWREVLAHDAQGNVLAGSLDDLTGAFAEGAAVKLAVAGLCADLAQPGQAPPPHELFVQAGSKYYYTEQRLFMVGSHPLVRVRPAIPMRYAAGAWDFGWLMARTDGHAVYRRCDPYTLRFTDHPLRCPLRWFVG